MTLDGPIPVMVRDPLTGELTDVPAAGVHYNADQATFAANEAALAPYRVEPLTAQRVWAGDRPDARGWTVCLRFPDQATAEALLSANAE